MATGFGGNHPKWVMVAPSWKTSQGYFRCSFIPKMLSVDPFEELWNRGMHDMEAEEALICIFYIEGNSRYLKTCS